MKYVLIIFILFISFSIESQNYSLGKIELKDTILTSQIKKFIIDNKENKEIFKTRGYIELRCKYVNKQTKSRSDLVYKYAIKDQYYIPKLDRIVSPQYYCYIEGKLILIYGLWSDLTIEVPKYKKRLKRKLRRLLKPYFDKPTHIKARDSTGKVVINDKNFIPEMHNLHGGITLSIFGNGEFKVEKGVY